MSEGYKGSYRRLFERQGEVESVEAREMAFYLEKGTLLQTSPTSPKFRGRRWRIGLVRTY